MQRFELHPILLTTILEKNLTLLGLCCPSMLVANIWTPLDFWKRSADTRQTTFHNLRISQTFSKVGCISKRK